MRQGLSGRILWAIRKDEMFAGVLSHLKDCVSDAPLRRINGLTLLGGERSGYGGIPFTAASVKG